MSGHSKWKNIMHKKEKTDAQRAKIFTKIGKEIAVAVKAGGPDPVSNAKLAQLIQKAKQNNVPNDNIERTIKKASSSDAASLEEMRLSTVTEKNSAIARKESILGYPLPDSHLDIAVLETKSFCANSSWVNPLSFLSCCNFSLNSIIIY